MVSDARDSFSRESRESLSCEGSESLRREASESLRREARTSLFGDVFESPLGDAPSVPIKELGESSVGLSKIASGKSLNLSNPLVVPTNLKGPGGTLDLRSKTPLGNEKFGKPLWPSK